MFCSVLLAVLAILPPFDISTSYLDVVISSNIYCLNLSSPFPNGLVNETCLFGGKWGDVSSLGTIPHRLQTFWLCDVYYGQLHTHLDSVLGQQDTIYLKIMRGGPAEWHGG